MPLMADVDDWTYEPVGSTAASDVDTVRFYVQDTDPALRLLADTEIQHLIDVWRPKYDSLIYCAAKAAEIISIKFAGVVSVAADGVSVNVADLSERYAAASRLLYQMHKDHQVGGLVDISNLMWGSTLDHGIAPLTFGLRLHDNREAGRQEYGGDQAPVQLRGHGASWLLTCSRPWCDAPRTVADPRAAAYASGNRAFEVRITRPAVLGTFDRATKRLQQPRRHGDLRGPGADAHRGGRG